jgi:hypothetical protein
MTNNFNLKKFLTENKLTKASVLREGFDGFKREDEGSKGVTAKNTGEEEVYGAGVKRGEKIEKAKMKKSALKAKIKEMILDEVNAPIKLVTTMDGKTIVGTHQYGVGFKSNENGKKMGFKDHPTSIPNGTKMSTDTNLAEDTYAPEFDVDPLAENEDYEKESRKIEFGINPETGEEEMSIEDDEDWKAKMKEAGFSDSDISDVLAKINREPQGIDEAKKDKDAPEEEIAPEELDANIDLTTPTDNVDTTFDISTSEVDPTIKAVQDALTQAQAAAQKLGDEKLTDQIGNTITFFTRTHIANKEPIQENEESTLINDYLYEDKDGTIQFDYTAARNYLDQFFNEDYLDTRDISKRIGDISEYVEKYYHVDKMTNDQVEEALYDTMMEYNSNN